MSNQICPCDSLCNPKDYEGRIMLLEDEGWHNWYFNGRIKDRFDVTSQGDYYDRMDSIHAEN